MIHLHGHQTTSFLDGYGTADQIIDRIVELGQSSIAVTDHGNVFGHVPVARAAKKRNIKPIYGCEFYIVDDITKRERFQASLGVNAFPHVTVLAANAIGYVNLLKLSRLSWENAYYKPRIDWRTLYNNQEGLIVLTGCASGYPTRLLQSSGYDATCDFIYNVSKHIKALFIELVPQPDYDVSHLTADAITRIAADLQLPLVLTADAHFPRPTDYAAQQIMLRAGMRKKITDIDIGIHIPPYQYYCSAEELFDRAQAVCINTPPEWLRQAIINTDIIGEICRVIIPQAEPVTFPTIPANFADSGAYLLDLAQRGIDTRKIAGQMLPGKESAYANRMWYEWEVICRRGFADYLLVVEDMVRHAKERNTVAACRGSAGGCLLLWLIGASETDPIAHNLSFERFFDDTRVDPPDVDMDFERGARDSVVEYVFNKYGRTKCSQITALSQLHARQALQDTAFVLNIPRAEYAKLSDTLTADNDSEEQLDDTINADAISIISKYPQLAIFPKLIGQYRQSSVNAAGLLISSRDLADMIGVVISKDGKPVAAVDKRGAADLGFLKMDVLSVNGLDIIGRALRNIGNGEVNWIYHIPLNDQAALQEARDGRLAGIFQLDGSSATRVIREIGADTFEDLIAASALCRPGPAKLVPLYALHKRDNITFQRYLNHIDPKCQTIVSSTYGAIIYQEQVMRLAREVAGFEWKDVHALRKAIQVKSGFNSEWEQKFIAGCIANNLSSAEATSWWEQIEECGGYLFNLAHGTTYALIGYWMLYLKAHFPAQFYEAYLALDDNEWTQKRLIREFMGLGGQIDILNPQYSGASFRAVTDKYFVGGYTGIKGIGQKTAEKLATVAPFASWGIMLAAMPKAPREALTAAKPTGNAPYNIQKLIRLAPWAPVPHTDEVEREKRIAKQLYQPGQLPFGSPINDIGIAGYVTVKEVSNDRAYIVVEDETGVILAKVAAKDAPRLLPFFKEILVSDYVAVAGWWTGDCLFVRGIEVLKR